GCPVRLRQPAHADHRNVRVSVPGDVAVTGWDDSDTAAPAGLTTLAQSLREQGAHCARAALGRPAGAPAEHAWQIIVRSTSRPHPGPAADQGRVAGSGQAAGIRSRRPSA
ncbi:substrate-binding domain-containing protein, partial [Actinoplanes philippinensis]